jgi:uncharacterized protein YkvS
MKMAIMTILNLNVRDRFGDLDVDGRTVLNNQQILLEK